MKRLLFAVLLGLLALASASVSAAQAPRYRYGETWWEEYENDRDTRLLLHFGLPTPTAHKQLASSVRREKTDQATLSEQDLEENNRRTSSGTELPDAPKDLQGLPPVDEKQAPAGAVLDYSDARRQTVLGPGLRLVPEGRFGSALACDGNGALTCRGGPVVCVEAWFYVEAYPAREACLLSVARDETRLLLRPDGRLELRLRKPNGIPSGKHLTPEALRLLLDTPAEIVSPEPVPLREWFHAAAYSRAHPTPGGGEPWDARLRVNGLDAAGHLSERFNSYRFFGTGEVDITVGNSAAGGQGLVGRVDELRVSSCERGHYERPALPWRDVKPERPFQFNRPFFREDATVFHASLDRGLALDLDTAGAGAIQAPVGERGLAGLRVGGIRGQGWLMDPEIGFARMPLKGLNTLSGALEFWLRPVNWDDMTGYWHHTPPVQKDLTVARLLGKDRRDGTLKPFLSVTLPRAHNLERARVPVDPGHWLHLAVVWDAKETSRAQLFIDGRAAGQAWRAPVEQARLLEPAWAEFGVSEKVAAKRGEAPRIEVDEMVGYRAALRADEVVQARRRWMEQLEPIKLYEDSFSFKWSLQKLEFAIIPLLPEGQTAAAATVALHDLNQGGKAVLGSAERTSREGEAFRFVLTEGKPFPYGAYQFRFQLKDGAGRVLTEGLRDWKYEEEAWRHCRAGILDRVPPPWTPIRVDGTTLETRMTRYVFGDDGLPREVHADGVNILAGPVQLLEEGQPLASAPWNGLAAKETEAVWQAGFTGKTCAIALRGTAEYDGMARYELTLRPKGKLGRLAFKIPLKAEHATHWLCYPVGARGVTTGLIGAQDGTALSSRCDPPPHAAWQAYQEERKANPRLGWEQFWAPRREKTQAYGFFTHVDLNDRNRGLWWFCDHAGGWSQSKQVGAVEVVRAGNVVSLVLNLVAESVEDQAERTIVFALLPHPARPLPEKYRLFNRVAPEQDPRACDVYDAFFPWPKSPRDHEMKLYPAADPADSKAGPSWAYAESCRSLMKASKPRGLRTMYLSKAWLSCRAGAYDNWEWRSGDSSACSLTPSFVNYLCWEMDEWIKRDLWDAVYLDECYEHPARNLEAGLSVRLPDGTEQPGVTNFQFRELMKRWRGIFHAHGKEPVLIAHLTYSFQYPGVVFCDSYLDGENRPIVSLRSPDWINSTSKTQFEVLQNTRLWGVSSFYMPFISEGGFEDKAKNQYARWQWRMARQAQSQFAHYETATVYEGQGSQVHRLYWGDVLGWGAGDPRVEFLPYWDNAKYAQVKDQGGETLVSLYRRPGKVLLIASNRATQDRVLKIRLDLKALGLRERPAARALDSSFAPPAGEDFVPAQHSARAKKELLDESARNLERGVLDETPGAGAEALPKDALVLEDPDAAKARQAAGLEPRLDGDVLVLPVRARDYRVITLE